MTVAVIGTTQTLAWASSYYLPAILADPIVAGLGIPKSLFFGCFSASLLLQAALGPMIGKAIDRVVELDALGLYDVVEQEDISMCGYGPATAMLTAARNLGASKADLVKYATSADVSGDFDRVVGYAGMRVT